MVIDDRSPVSRASGGIVRHTHTGGALLTGYPDTRPEIPGVFRVGLGLGGGSYPSV